MNIILNLILSFYPTTLLWYSIPSSLLKRIDSFGSTSSGHFFVRAIVYILIFIFCYLVIQRYVTVGYLGRRQTLANILGALLLLILATFVFYSILPGANVYATPALVNQYILKGYYPFLAVILPIVYLYFI